MVLQKLIVLLVLLGNQNPGRVFLVKMPGRMGHQNNTGFNLEVLHTDGEAGILIVKGTFLVLKINH